jgi:predicted DNA-binding protein
MARSSKKVITTIYLNPDQKEKLRRLSAKTRVPISEFIREGVDHVLKRYQSIMSNDKKTVVVTK